MIAADQMDRHVGARIKQRRKSRGLSMDDLAAKIGVSYQQVNKYEICQNRISAGRLYDVAEALDVPVSFFFDEFLHSPEARQ